jgi:putative ABC transport system substrate-binding protein
MDRRRFLLSSLAGALAVPLAAEAQQAGKTWRVGVLASANPGVYDALVDELRRFGYFAGQNLHLERRSAEGNVERLPALAADVVRAGVDVIVAAGGVAQLQAARQATASVPIVIVAIDYDPLALGYVGSLARPGGNVTGIVLQQLELSSKRLELLKAVLPKLARLAILWDPTAEQQFKAAEAASKSFGLQVQSLEVQHPPDGLSGAFATAARNRADALIVVTTSVFYRERVQIAELAVKSRIPAMYPLREFTEAGGLMSYGTYLPDMLRRAAIHVDKILKGAKPAEVPIEQPTKFDLVINLKTAKALGLTVPPSLLARADQVIE